MKLFDALCIIGREGMKVSRIDEGGSIYDLDLSKKILDVAKEDDPSVVNFGFVRNHPTLFYKDGWKVGRKLNRRDLVDRFDKGSLTDDEILDILDDCKRNNKLSVETTAQYDWDEWFNGYRGERMEKEGMTQNEYVASWGANDDLPITSKDPLAERKRKRLAELKKLKEFRGKTEGKDDLIPFSITTIRDAMEKLGIIESDDVYGYFPGEPYLVPKDGIIKLRKSSGSPGSPHKESNRWYKWAKIDVFRDPKDKEYYRFCERSGYVCSKKDLEDACRKIGEMDWMDIKDYPYKK